VTVRFGIVGYGMIADAHANAIQSSGEAELVSVADPVPEARRAAVERWGCSAFESVDQMLREVEINAACVCAPPVLHRGLTEALLNRGVHVLCEKPLGVTARDARAMVALAEERGLVLAVSSKFRFVPALVEAHRLIHVGTIGHPITCEVTLCAQNPAARGWYHRPKLSGGGVVMDNGPQAYDMISVVLGEHPLVTSALFAPRSMSPEVEDTAEILFRTAGPVIGRIALSWAYFTKELDYIVIHGRRGSLRVGWRGSGLRIHGDAEWTSFGNEYDKRKAFVDQLRAFISSVRGLKATEPASEAIAALDFVERVYETERLGRAGSSVDSTDIACTGHPDISTAMISHVATQVTQ
jgi:predicted dehydrogenase